MTRFLLRCSLHSLLLLWLISACVDQCWAFCPFAVQPLQTMEKAWLRDFDWLIVDSSLWNFFLPRYSTSAVTEWKRSRTTELSHTVCEQQVTLYCVAPNLSHGHQHKVLPVVRRWPREFSQGNPLATRSAASLSLINKSCKNNYYLMGCIYFETHPSKILKCAFLWKAAECYEAFTNCLYRSYLFKQVS